MSAAANAIEASAPVELRSPAKGLQLVESPVRSIDRYELLPWLPCTLTLDIPVIRFTVRDLLGLCGGTIVETAYHQSSDLPLQVNGQLLGWTEFEVVGDRLAVRLTDVS